MAQSSRLAAALACLATILFVASSSPAAPAAVVPDESTHVTSLDGTWRFKLEQPGGYDAQARNGEHLMPILTPATFEPFQKLEYQEGPEWTNLIVPGNWEMAGLSPATYDQPDNASGFYRLWIDVPASWQGREVRLAFDGVQNGAEFWLNGNPVAVDEPSWGRENYHESGWTAFQVDLTPQVKFGGKNLLAIRVTKNTRSSDLDSGDYFFLGGVYRTVELFSVPQTHVADVTVQTRLLDGNRAEIKVLAAVAGADAASVSMKLGGIKGETDAKIENGQATLVQIVEQPKLWSAEFPNLYPLTLELKDADGQTTETIARKIGVREITIKNAVLLVNGVPVKLAGVCRHDVYPTEGTAVGPDLWRKDITLMKAANINAIRTSHYPYGAGFYDLCDQLGMYVVDELPYCWCPTDDAGTKPAFEQRARETVRRDKNHPSVIAWTIGNENKAGQNLQVVADLVKQLDPTRPRNVSCFDGEKYHVEFDDSHYSPPSAFPKQAEHSRATGQPHIHLENPNTWDIRLAADPGMWEHWGPVMQREWDACLQYDTVPGLFPFEWQDRAVADHCPTKLYTYFPETGINLLKIKGLVDGFRNPRPSLYEVKMVYSPVKIGDPLAVADGQVSFPVTNRYSFTDLSDLKMNWELQQNGKSLASGTAQLSQPPLTSGTAQLALPAGALAKADALEIEFIHPDGDNVVGHRFVLKEAPATSRLNSALPDGLAIPRFNLITRVTHRDPKGWREATRYPARLANIVMQPPGATTLAQLKDFTADVMGTNDEVVGKIRAQYADGEFSYRLEWSGRNAEVQELGWAFDLPGACDHFSWNRSARWTIYPDYDIGRAAGTATPDSMNVPLTRMDRPDAFDFNSTKYDCNWASLTTKAGAGLRVEFDPQQRFHCRGGAADGGAGYVLFVNQQVSPPDDISKDVVKDFYLTLKAGRVMEGHFRIGSNQILN
jgi:beta-galactosidase